MPVLVTGIHDFARTQGSRGWPAFADHDVREEGGGELRPQVRYITRSTINCLIAPIALAGLRPLGQVWVQFMMVWQR